MKKTNKVLVTLAFILLAFALFSISEVKAASASITDDKTIKVGETIEVKGTIVAGVWDVKLKGNQKTVELLNGSSNNYSSIDGNETITKSISFTPTSTGKYTFTLSGTIADYVTEQSESVNKTCTINVVDPPKEEQPEQSASTVTKAQASPEKTTSSNQESSKSSNNYLKSLSFSEGTLAPEFYRGTTDYTLEFAEDFDLKSLSSIKVSASAEDSKASVSGTGEKTLEDGENIIQVVCTAENGSARTYNIKIVKPTPIVQSDLRLKMLEVNEIDKDGFFTKATLNIPFDPEKFEYELNVGKDVNDLDIDARVEKEGILVKIEGANNLNDGENEVRIILTSQDDEQIQTTYIIKVTKQAEEKIETEETNGIMGLIKKIGYKKLLIIIGGIIGLLVVILIILIIISHKKKKNKKDKVKWNEENIEGSVIENQEGEDVVEEKIEVQESKTDEEDSYSKTDYSNLSSEDYDYARFKELFDKREEDNKPISEEKKPEIENDDYSYNKTADENNTMDDNNETDKETKIKPVLGKNEQIFNTSYDDEDYKVDINHDYIAYKTEPIDVKKQKKLEKQKRKEAAKRQVIEEKEERSQEKSRDRRHKGKHF